MDFSWHGYMSYCNKPAPYDKILNYFFSKFENENGVSGEFPECYYKAYTASLQKSQILITQKGLWAPHEGCLVDNTLRLTNRLEQGNPEILPTESNKLPAESKKLRVTQYAILLHSLGANSRGFQRHSQLVDDAMPILRNELTHAVSGGNLRWAKALIRMSETILDPTLSRCDIRWEFDRYTNLYECDGLVGFGGRFVLTSIERAIRAGDLEVARLMLLEADPVPSAMEKGQYHALVKYRPSVEVETDKPSMQQVINAQDYETFILMRDDNSPMSSAALRGDWDMVRRLVEYGCDPNLGPTFMERPLPLSILRGNLDMAQFLLDNHARRDLGDQFYPLREAVRRRNVADAKTVLERPRLFKSATVETNQQILKRIFRDLYEAFQTASQCNSSREFKDLGAIWDSHKSMWRDGMAGVRRLVGDRRPKNFRQVIGTICVASAMRESIQSEDSFGSYDLFLEDLNRWKNCAVLESDRKLFDEIALAIWGNYQTSTKTPDTLDKQVEDRDRLCEMIRKLVERFTAESSLPLVQLENVEEFWDYDKPSNKTSIVLFQPKNSQNEEGSSSDIPQNTQSSEPAANQGRNPSTKDPPESSARPPGLIPAFLMMGAIFACILSFMYVLQTGSLFLAPSRDIAAPLRTSYWTLASQSLAELSSADKGPVHLEAREKFITGHLNSLGAIRSLIFEKAQTQFDICTKKLLDINLRHAATLALVYLEGWALRDRYVLVELFLKTWVTSGPSTHSATYERDYSDQFSQTTSNPTSPGYPAMPGPGDKSLIDQTLFSSHDDGRMASSTPGSFSSSLSATPTQQSGAGTSSVNNRSPRQSSAGKRRSPVVGSKIERHKYPCKICPRTFVNVGNLNRHLTETHQCQTCPTILVSKEDLNRHRIEMHPISQIPLCKWGCGYESVRRGNVVQHELKRCPRKGAILP
ncbi:hypothetical protein B0J14DRAFT_609149 [Halenospora varia]|nr:hypothetical protein B0J14DRAFT_609149 [Halenospora varia]